MITPVINNVPPRFPRRVLVVAVLVVAALGAAAVPLLARWRTSRETVVPPVIPPADSVVAVIPPSPDPAPPKDTVARTVRSDSARAPTIPARRDSTPKPTSTLARLSLSAPNDARLSVNGVAVGDGRWRADTLKAAEYILVAAIDAIDGCESARDEKRVRLRAGTQQDIILSPLSCGTVEIDGQPTGAYYLINSGDGTVKREGNLPLEKGLVLPIGGYHFTAQKPQCAQYEQDFSLTAGQTLRIPFRMICASP